MATQNKPLKIDLKKVHLVTHWQFNLASQNCEICRKDLTALPPTDLLNLEANRSASVKDLPVLGACGHAFHSTCINSSIANHSAICPIDGTQWQTSKNLINCATWGIVDGTN